MKPLSKAILLTALAALAAFPPQARAVLPQWYIDAGLSAADADGDGIPDAWERRTFGDPGAFDSDLDRDGDGLTDLEEFTLGTDPRTFGTAGDLWSDGEKVQAGLDPLARVSPAVTFAQWLSYLNCDAETWRTLTATNGEGFAGAYVNFVCNTPPYSAASGAADFWLATRTDRPAWLTVADALTTNSFPVRAGAGRVRLRAAYGGPVSLTLDPLPGTLAGLPGATNGLWLCEMRVEPFRANTVVFSDGVTPPAVPGDPDSVDGLLLSAPQPGPAVHSLTSPPPRVTFQPLRMTDGSAVLGNGGWYCLCASEPSCTWPDYAMIGCDPVSMMMNAVDGDTPILTKEAARVIFWERFPCVECTVTQTVANATYPFIYGKVIFSFRQCEAHGGVIGAEESQPWHEPGYSAHSGCSAIGCVCDDGPKWVVGFDHWLVNTRNLSRIATDNLDVDTTEHCLGLVWKEGGSTNLFSLLDGLYPACEYDLDFTSDNLTINNDGELVFEGNPKDLEPNICLIKLHYKPSSEVDQVFDKLWVVINRPDTETRFNSWYAQNSDISWTTNLPPPYSSITLSTNASNEISCNDPELGAPNLWGSPHIINSYLHHTAKFEMRSGPVSGGHGHQATYNEHGVLIEDPIAAGTADISAPYDVDDEADKWRAYIHREKDVYPFIRALQLDGNPVNKVGKKLIVIDSPENLTRPCIYKGPKTDQYVARRPVLPTGKQ